jgi:Periplasmic copper-binding protein (NosD)
VTLLVPAAVLAFTAAAFLLVGGGRAVASHVDCGDTITADTTLDSDLEDCPNNGVVIGAAGVTLDLNGHRIEGDGKPAAGCDPRAEPCDFGVLNEGFNGVTVEHGSVRRFAVGGFAVNARKNRVLDIGATRNVFFGWLMSESSRSVIRAGAFRRNIPPKGNVFSRNSPSITLGGDERPAEANRNRIRRNEITEGGGILVGPGNRNIIAKNRVVQAFESIGIDKGHGNRVTRNRVVHPRGTGIRLAIRRPSIGPVRTVVARNRVRASGEDGFLVNAKARRGLLWRNVALRSRDDGFDIVSDRVRIARNRADHNGDLGIEAQPGAIDGGGNVAHDNGDPLQCRYILCS